jgi:hypothetical protein
MFYGVLLPLSIKLNTITRFLGGVKKVFFDRF